MFRGTLVAILLVAGLCLGGGIVSANEPPLVDAGLDQNVETNTTVYLDAGGSVDPDGDIVSYRWNITAPNGSTFTPGCPTCVRTRFLAAEAGTYNATVEVTDDDGTSRSDTMVVTVESSNPPSIELTGPTSPGPGTTGTYNAQVTRGDSRLATVRWERNGTELDRESVGNGNASPEMAVTHSNAGRRTISAVVVDVSGQTARDTLTVNVQNDNGPPGSGSPGSGNSPSTSSSPGSGGSSPGPDSSPSTSSGSTNTGGDSFFREIESGYIDGEKTYTFKFVGDDTTASNRKADDPNPNQLSIGSDRDGYGVDKSTLRTVSGKTDDVEKTQTTTGVEAYRATGQVADNFGNHSEVMQPVGRIGTYDKITEQDLLQGIDNSSSNSVEADTNPTSRSTRQQKNDPTDDYSGGSTGGKDSSATSSENIGENSGKSSDTTSSENGDTTSGSGSSRSEGKSDTSRSGVDGSTSGGGDSSSDDSGIVETAMDWAAEWGMTGNDDSDSGSNSGGSSSDSSSSNDGSSSDDGGLVDTVVDTVTGDDDSNSDNSDSSSNDNSSSDSGGVVDTVVDTVTGGNDSSGSDGDSSNDDSSSSSDSSSDDGGLVGGVVDAVTGGDDSSGGGDSSDNDDESDGGLWGWV